MNRREKFDAASFSFILGGKIRNRTHTHSNQYIRSLPIGVCGQKTVPANVAKDKAK